MWIRYTSKSASQPYSPTSLQGYRKRINNSLHINNSKVFQDGCTQEYTPLLNVGCTSKYTPLLNDGCTSKYTPLLGDLSDKTTAGLQLFFWFLIGIFRDFYKERFPRPIPTPTFWKISFCHLFLSRRYSHWPPIFDSLHNLFYIANKFSTPFLS